MRFGAGKGWIVALLLFSSLLLHEAGHVAAARFAGVRVKALGFCGRGSYIRREPARDAAAEVFVTLAGPISSLFLAGVLYNNGTICNWLAGLNLLLGVSNLVLPNSDGSRAASSMLRWWRSRKRLLLSK